MLAVIALLNIWLHLNHYTPQQLYHLHLPVNANIQCGQFSGHLLRNLKQMTCGSRRPHRVLLRSAKNKELKLEAAWSHETEGQQKIGKMLPCVMSVDFCCHNWIGW